MIDFKVILEDILPTIRNTGAFIKGSAGGLELVDSELKAKRDLVTKVDVGAEQMLVEGCKKVLPEAGFIAEESGKAEENKEFVWVIDPIDGTTNFVHGIPHFGISVALMQSGKPVIGIILDVMKNELFTAILGSGAFLNGKPINVSSTSELTSSLIGTGFPPPRIQFNDAWFDILKEIIVNTHGMRRNGAACLDLAYVACGRLDGYYEVGLNPWDVAAGAIIVAEAGGKVSAFRDGENYLFDEKILATNGAIHSALLSLILRNI